MADRTDKKIDQCAALECTNPHREDSAFCSAECRNKEQQFLAEQALAGNSHAFEAGIPCAQIE